MPVIWMHGLECTCCSESFIRSAHPLVKDVVLSMISLDYDDTIMAAAGHQAEAILEETREKYKGQYILAVEGNPPLNEDGMYCIDGGRPFVEKLKEMADDAMAVIAWGSCASWGCVQAAKPNPTQAVPIDKVITQQADHQGAGLPADRRGDDRRRHLHHHLRHGCPSSTARAGRRCSIRSASTTNAIAGRISTPASSSRNGTTTPRARATASTRWAARARPPTTPARPCAGTAASRSRSSPATAASAARKTASGTRAAFYDRLTNIQQFGIEANADKIGATAAGAVGVGDRRACRGHRGAQSDAQEASAARNGDPTANRPKGGDAAS